MSSDKPQKPAKASKTFRFRRPFASSSRTPGLSAGAPFAVVLEKALRSLKKKKKILWLHSYADWNQNCAQWRRDVLRSAALVSMKSHFEWLEFEADEHPEVDFAMQSFAQNMGVQAGWPLNLFLDSDGKALFCAGALEARAFGKLLGQLVAAAKLDFDHLREQKVAAFDSFRSADKLAVTRADWPKLEFPWRTETKSSDESWDLSRESFLAPLLQSTDFATGLMGGEQATHYPQAYKALVFSGLGNPCPGEIALAKLATTPLADVLGGGFFRTYSPSEMRVSAQVETEKLLCENAELLDAYVASFEKTKSPFIAQVATDLARCLMEDFYIPEENRFCKALAAAPDFYLISNRDLLEALSGTERQAAQQFFAVSDQPKIPRVASTVVQLSGQIGNAPADLKNTLATVQLKLKNHRALRSAPQKLGWNLLAECLALRSLWRAQKVMSVFASQSESYRRLWRRCSDLVLWAQARDLELQGTQQGWALCSALLAWVEISRGVRSAEVPENEILILVDNLLSPASSANDSPDIDREFAVSALVQSQSWTGDRFAVVDHLSPSPAALFFRAHLERAALKPGTDAEDLMESLMVRLDHLIARNRKLGISAAGLFALAVGHREKFKYLNLKSFTNRNLSH